MSRPALACVIPTTMGMLWYASSVLYACTLIYMCLGVWQSGVLAALRHDSYAMYMSEHQEFCCIGGNVAGMHMYGKCLQA